MTRYLNNTRFALMTDDQLKELLRVRLKEDRLGFKIIEIVVADKKNGNNDNEPYWVGYEYKTIETGWEQTGIMFKRFSIAEWDFIHTCLEDLHAVPVSELLLRKNGHIVDLECSQRGYQSAMKSLKTSLASLHDQITA